MSRGDRSQPSRGKGGHPRPGEQRLEREGQPGEPGSGKLGAAEAHRASILVSCGWLRGWNLKLAAVGVREPRKGGDREQMVFSVNDFMAAGRMDQKG